MNKYEEYMKNKEQKEKQEKKAKQEREERAKEAFDRRLEGDFSSIFAFFDAELAKEEKNKENYIKCFPDILAAAGSDKDSRDKYLSTYSEVISDYDKRIERIKEEKGKATKLQEDMNNLMQSIGVYKGKVEAAKVKVTENRNDDDKEKLQKHEKIVSDTFEKLVNQESKKISEFKSLKEATLVKGDMDALNNDDIVKNNLDAPIDLEDKKKIDKADEELNKKSLKDRIKDYISGDREKKPVTKIKRWSDKLKGIATSKKAKTAAIVGLGVVATVVAALAMGNPAVVAALGSAAEYAVAGSMLKK